MTKEGELLYSHVEIAYRHLLNAQEELCRQDAGRGGTVEIGATEAALHLFLLHVLHDFKMEYPAIKIKIHNHTTWDTLKHLMNGKMDLAVITTPFEVPKTYACVKALDFHEILAGGTQYANLCGKLLKLQDVREYPWIGLGRGSATYQLYKDFFISHKIDLELDMEVATSDLMLPLIENNLGIGFVPEKLALPYIEKKKMVQIPLDCDIPQRSIQIVLDKGRGRSLAADTFYKYLKSQDSARQAALQDAKSVIASGADGEN